MMKFLFLAALAVFTANQLSAQLPEDAIRMSWSVPSGTARNQAIGGAMGSLGGEITSVFVNPAGIGSYKTSEFVFTPAFSFFGGKGGYRSTSITANSDSKFILGTTGFVLGQQNQQSKWNSKAFSIAISRTANFNSSIRYRGDNDFSSFSESFAEEFANSGLPINTVLYDAPLSFGTKLANYTYLIDTLTANGVTQVIGLPERNSILTGTDMMLRQEKQINTKGGITEIAFAYAANMDDKLYIGGSLGIPIVNYERTSLLTETDISGNDDSDFGFASYNEVYEASGFGINARIGMILKPSQNFRTGFAIHTPTLYGLKETTTGYIEADFENYLTGGSGSFANEDTIYSQFGFNVPEFRYDLISPWKFLVSGSYMFGGSLEDVTQQKGFITADIEYVTHRSSRFRAADPGEDGDYYDAVNEGVKVSYKGAFNVRIGGELKFNTIMTRLGFSYYGNPYDDTQLKARKMNVSGGLGYRNRGVFIDAAYVLGLNKDVNFPYRLADKANTYATVKDNNGSLVFTIGFKF